VRHKHFNRILYFPQTPVNSLLFGFGAISDVAFIPKHIFEIGPQKTFQSSLLLLGLMVSEFTNKNNDKIMTKA